MMHHLVTGPVAAPALVLSNSLGTSTAMWDPQAEALSERFRVVRYDHRGHGAAPVPRGPYELADLGRDVVQLLDRLEIERASVCGVSLGGMVGVWLGLHAPERVDRLVLCCTSAHLPPASAWAERAATVLEAGSTAPIADAVLGRWLTPVGAASRPELVERLRRMLLATPPEGYAACCGVIERLDLRDSLPAITAPTLAIAGAQDPATPPEHLEAIAAAVPDARLQVLDGAAHLANLERPEAVAQLILEHCGGRAWA